MGWTVIIEDENGNVKREMPDEFRISDNEVFNGKEFQLLKYLDPFGDTTFNSLMFEDLIRDLIELQKQRPADMNQIETVISYAKECKANVHTYLKFYGD